jgi:hypothetical protein
MRSWSRSSLSSSWSNASRMASRSGRLKNWFTLFHSAHHTSKTSHFNRHIWTPLPLRHHLLSPKMPNHHRAAPYRVQTPALSTDQSATARIPSPLLSKSCRPLLSNEYDQARGIYELPQSRHAYHSTRTSCTKVTLPPAQLRCRPYTFLLRFLRSFNLWAHTYGFL